jgi:hypothetical protein
VPNIFIRLQLSGTRKHIIILTSSVTVFSYFRSCDLIWCPCCQSGANKDINMTGYYHLFLWN